MPVCKHTVGDGNFASPACLAGVGSAGWRQRAEGEKTKVQAPGGGRRSGKEFGHLIYVQKMKGFPQIQCRVTTFLQLFTLEMRK